MDDANTQATGSLLVYVADRGVVDRDGTLVARVDTGDYLAERRLTGAILSEQRTDLSRFNAYRDSVESAHTWESFGQITDVEPRSHDHAHIAVAWSLTAVRDSSWPT